MDWYYFSNSSPISKSISLISTWVLRKWSKRIFKTTNYFEKQFRSIWKTFQITQLPCRILINSRWCFFSCYFISSFLTIYWQKIKGIKFTKFNSFHYFESKNSLFFQIFWPCFILLKNYNSKFWSENWKA